MLGTYSRIISRYHFIVVSWWNFELEPSFFACVRVRRTDCRVLAMYIYSTRITWPVLTFLSMAIWLVSSANAHQSYRANLESNEASAVVSPITIATVALSDYNPRPLVESLRRAGKWTGRIVVISDTNSSYALVKEFGAEIVLVELSPSTSLEAKSFKTTVLSDRRVSPQAPLASRSNDGGGGAVLFLDADVEVNRDISEFLRSSERTSLAASCAASFLPERLYYRLRRGHLWNSGIFFVRNSPDGHGLLAAWADAINRDPSQRFDQSALMTVVTESSYFRQKLCPLPAGHVTFVPSAANLLLLGWSDLRTTFTHWATSATNQRGPSGLAGVLRSAGHLRGTQPPPVRRRNR